VILPQHSKYAPWIGTPPFFCPDGPFGIPMVVSHETPGPELSGHQIIWMEDDFIPRLGRRS
jgi:hypothetical protein